MSKNYILPLLFVFCAPLLAACSTVTNGSTQQVSFKAVGADDVFCDVLIGANDYKYTVRPPQSVWVVELQAAVGVGAQGVADGAHVWRARAGSSSGGEGRMAGPPLGRTGAGNYDIARDNLDIDGVVAPSPMLNLSMLGSIPVIGDLLVSRRGEGVFGMTYSINGHAGEPRVGVNPVSALTPGILRRIFEPVPPRQTETPAREGAGAPAFDPSGSTPVAPDPVAPATSGTGGAVAEASP